MRGLLVTILVIGIILLSACGATTTAPTPAPAPDLEPAPAPVTEPPAEPAPAPELVPEPETVSEPEPAPTPSPEPELTPTPEPAPTPIVNKTTHGYIRWDETWQGEIRIVGDITVGRGYTLTIEPGTKVLIAANQDVANLSVWPFDMQKGIRQEVPGEDPYYQGVHFGEPFRDEGNHISIYVYGTLHAVGTPEQMITITSDSPTPGIYDWNHFSFDNGILSYCIMEYYRCFEPGNDTVVSHNILRHVGECAVCFFSGYSALVEYNTISYAGHELIGIGDSSPTIRNSYLGPNPLHEGIVIDGGSPEITNNTINSCVHGINFISPPDAPIIEDNIFLNNGQDIFSFY